MADWDVNSPSDSDFIAQFPANERAARAALVANFGVDHEANAEDANIGKHVKVSLVDQSSDPAGAAGSSTLYAKEVSGASQLFWRSGTEAVVQLTAAGGLRAESLVGTVPNARLSSDVPLKNAPNVFTVQQTIQRAGDSPSLTVERTGSASNAAIEAKTTGGSVYFGNSDGSTFAIGASNNLGSSPWVSVSGSEFEVNATTLDFNGNADISGTLAVGGAATFSNNVSVSGTITGNGSGLSSLNASNLSSGTVPSDRLPSTIGGNKTFSNNVAVGGNADISGTLAVGGASTFAASTFSGTVTLSGVAGARVFDIVNTDESQIWAMRARRNLLQIGARTSGGSWSNPPAFEITRSGNTITEVAVPVAVRAGTAATSTSSTLEAGRIHHRSSNTTVPSMNAGQWVAVQNTSTSSITLSQGSGVTLELGGTTTTGNRTLLPKGFAFIYFRANGVGVVHGSGVT